MNYDTEIELSCSCGGLRIINTNQRAAGRCFRCDDVIQMEREPLTDFNKFKFDTIEAVKNVDIEQVQKLTEAIRQADHVYIFGNGGSAATASHFALDATKNGKQRVICLNDSITTLTALSNDYDFTQIFSRQLSYFVNARTGNNLIIGISTSGNSENVIEGIRSGNAWQGTTKTAVLTGFDGGPLHGMGDINIHVDSDCIEAVEDAHMALLHWVVRGLKSG